MIVLIDTDILIDVALERNEFFKPAAKVLDLAEMRFFRAFIAWHSLSNFYYLVASPGTKKRARKFITEFLEFIEVAAVATADALIALSLNLTDFEDAMQVASAKSCKADYIVTRNIKHYNNSPIKALKPDDFLKLIDVY